MSKEYNRRYRVTMRSPRLHYNRLIGRKEAVIFLIKLCR